MAGDRAGLATCLGLGERDLLPDEDARVVSTGAAHLLVPAADRKAVDRAAPDPARLKSALRQAGAEGWIPGESTVIIEQGHALGRPSRIAVSLADQRVRVGGSGLVIADGTLIV